MNYNRVGFVGTTLLFFLMISPAGAESVADKLKQTLDKLKQLQGQQQPNQASSPAGQAAAPNQNNAANGGDKTSSSVSSGGSKAAGSGGAGPDVIGLRLRMTPAEVELALKTRPNLKNIHASHGIWKYPRPNSNTYADIPGGQFHSLTRGYDDAHLKNQFGTYGPIGEGVIVHFAPVPGKERVVGVSRIQNLPEGKQPEYDTLIKSFIEKYGTPTFRSADGQRIAWMYDANFQLKAKSTTDPYKACIEVPRTNRGTIHNLERNITWELARPDNSAAGSLSRCGEVTLSVIVWRAQNSPLAGSLETRLSGFGDMLKAQQAVDQIINTAQKNATGKQIEKAKQNKPDL